MLIPLCGYFVYQHLVYVTSNNVAAERKCCSLLGLTYAHPLENIFSYHCDILKNSILFHSP